jgi:predicted lipid-binding transport protein (Tim44 family)
MESSPQGAGAPGEQATRELPPVGAPAAGPSPAAAQAAAGADAFSERPELFVGAAFAGGLVLAQILKRFGR